MVTINYSAPDVYGYFASRVWIQGVHNKSDHAFKPHCLNVGPHRPLECAFRDAYAELSNFATNPDCQELPSFRKLQQIHSRVYMKIGTQDEVDLSSGFQDGLTYLGEVFAGDEKLFHFTGRSGMIRKVVNKPARIGLWHYQGAVYLESGLPYIVYTRAHTTSASLGMKTPTSKIVKEWGKIVLDNGQEATVVCDAYYLDNECRAWLNANKVRLLIVCACNCSLCCCSLCCSLCCCGLCCCYGYILLRFVVMCVFVCTFFFWYSLLYIIWCVSLTQGSHTTNI